MTDQSNYLDQIGQITTSTLTQHLVCKYCFKKLSSKQCMREHSYIHTGEKPYICTEVGCNMSFRQASLLSAHRKIHIGTRIQADSHLEIVEIIENSIKIPRLTKLLENSKTTTDLPLQAYEKDRWEKKIEISQFDFVNEFLKDII